MENCIFLTFDDVYYNYARICLNSFEANYPDHPSIKIIYTGKDDEIRKSLSARHNVEVMDYELDMNQFDKLNLGLLTSHMIYARFVLWTELFDKFNKVLYLDCDTIVLKPFPEVFERDDFFAISDNTIQKVFLDNETISPSPTFLAALEKDRMNLDEVNNKMINSGFFLLPKKYRTQVHLAQIWNIIATYNDYIQYSDQSIISIWMHLNGIKSSDLYQYNFQTQFILKDTLQLLGADNIKIMHYSGWKPDKNFQHLIIPANYILSVVDNFNKYSK